MTLERFFASDAVRPSEEVQKGIDELEAALEDAVNMRASSPFTPDELLSHARANFSAQLQRATGYFHSTGFVQSPEPSVAVLYHALHINPSTGRGRRVSLVRESGRVILDYFPGYSAATPLRQFLMQEFPLPLSTVSGKGRNLHPRETRVNQLVSELYVGIRKYQSRKRLKLDVPNASQLTVGSFAALPPEVTSAFKDTIYPLLKRHGLTESR